jgi:ribosomal protein L33
VKDAGSCNGCEATARLSVKKYMEEKIKMESKEGGTRRGG